VKIFFRKAVLFGIENLFAFSCIFIPKMGKIIILEVDIYNSTKETKIKNV
jgi:hypothetical protein